MKKALKRFLAFAMVCITILSMSVSAFAIQYSVSYSDSYKSSKYYTALQKVSKTGDQRKDIVAIAKSQVGYYEGNNSTELNGAENAKHGNYTEYSRWFDDIKGNTGKNTLNGQAWCQMFVSWCAACAGIDSSIVPCESWTVTALRVFKKQGNAYEPEQVTSGAYTPQAGDLVFFDTGNGNEVGHVGIVYDYSNGVIYTYEGNAGQDSSGWWGAKVQACKYTIKSASSIKYICSPNYNSSKSSSSTSTTTTAINITQSSVSVTVGNTTKLSCNKSSGVTWKSNNTSVATVSSSGTVTAKKAGTATITATCNGKSDTCTVKVVPKTSVHTTKVTLSSSSAKITVGSTKQLTATRTPSNSTDSVTWKSSDTSVATVSSSGKVTAKNPGKTTITATSNGKKATCTVTVVDKAALTVNLTSYPTSITKSNSFGLKGTITSGYKITKVQGYVINSSGKTVLSSTDTPNSTSMNIQTAKLNSKLTFNTLATGKYTLKIVATDAGGRTKTISKTFTVVKSTLKIDLTSYPSSIKKGSSYGLRGTVSSNVKITKVQGYVINSSGKTVLSSTDTPNSTSMDIKTAKLNSKLAFNKLAAGTYTLKVVATDASGNSVTWSNTFKVTK